MAGSGSNNRWWNEHELEILPVFDRALALRIEGEVAEAVRICHEVLGQLEPEDFKLRAAVHSELGHIATSAGDFPLAEKHFRIAAQCSPRSELPSLGLFHALWVQGRPADALRELRRLAALRYSRHCDEILQTNFKDVTDESLRKLADEARALLKEQLEKN